MIWTSFESINRRNEWMRESLAEIKKSMLEYLRDAVGEAGVIFVTYNKKPARLVTRTMEDGEKAPLIILKDFNEEFCCNIPHEPLFAICKEVREQHLFKEYGDPEDEPLQEEGAIASSNNN